MTTTSSRSRIFVITLTLAACGAVAGAITAAASMALLIVLRFGITAVADVSNILPSFALWGAVAGSVFFPAAAWLLLRRVNIGHALAVIGGAIIVGALVGEWIRPFQPYEQVVPGLFVGAAACFAVSVAVLRRRAERIQHTTEPHTMRCN